MTDNKAQGATWATLNRAGVTARSRALRSRVSNGTALFVEGGDGRGPWARRMRDILIQHAEDLGGTDDLTEAKRSLIRRIATISVELERFEARFSTGQSAPEDFVAYLSGANTLGRLLNSIGLERVPKDVTPDLATYLASKQEKP